MFNLFADGAPPYQHILVVEDELGGKANQNYYKKSVIRPYTTLPGVSIPPEVILTTAG